MSAVRNAKRVSATLLVVLAGLALVSSVVYAASTKPGITVQISPASQSIERGNPATYTVTLTSTGSFTGAVAMSASGLPGGTTATFNPATTPALTASGTASTATSILTVTTTTSTPVGSYTFTVTGTNGKVSGSVTAGLTVNLPKSPGTLSMSVTPASLTLAPGETAAYTIQLARTNPGGPVTFSVTGLPSGATATFAPTTNSGNTSTLQVTTLDTTRDDTYTLNLVASGTDTSITPLTATASVKMVVITKGKAFTITGNVSGLAPGLTRPLEPSLTNPNKKPVSVTNLSVTLQRVVKASGAPTGLCDLSDYAVVQYSGPYPLVLPGSSTKTLAQLGVGVAQKPQIQFINKPGPSAANNQDGCKGATLQLSYSGSAQGN